MQRSYLDYAMSVIVGRALPDVRDGLKPVHRKILYAMFDSGFRPDRGYVKCARIVGDVMGNYHPHGDSAIYDTLVRMAQPWSLRYPLIDGNGNFGSPGNDPAAAMRYTESRLDPLAMEMLRDIDEDTVDFGPNYDGRTQEPAILPARFPNLLVNGSDGIAVGMATKIPPHNLREIAAAVQWCLEQPGGRRGDHPRRADQDRQGSGLPDRRADRRHGRDRGRVPHRPRLDPDAGGRRRRGGPPRPGLPGRHRAAVPGEPGQPGRALRGAGPRGQARRHRRHPRRVQRPHRHAAGAGAQARRGGQGGAEQPLQAHPAAGDVRRQHAGPGRRRAAHAEPGPVHPALRRRTRSRSSAGAPQYRLRKAEERAHILRGLVKALDALDEVIALIRRSPTVEEARTGLMQLLDIDEIQATAILDMQLRRIAALERQKIVDELAKIEIEIAELKDILAKPERQRKIVSDELAEIVNKWGDERRTRIVPFDGEVSIEDLIAREDVVVTITRTGYAKRTKTDLYRSQRRGGKGVSGATLRQDDIVSHFFVCSTHDWILFFTNKGRVYRAKAYELPEASRVARGQHVANLLAFQPDEHIAQVIEIQNYEVSPYLVLATKKGLVKKTSLDRVRLQPDWRDHRDQPARRRRAGRRGAGGNRGRSPAGEQARAGHPVQGRRRSAASHGTGHFRRDRHAVHRGGRAARHGGRPRRYGRACRDRRRIRQAHSDRGVSGAG